MKNLIFAFLMIAVGVVLTALSTCNAQSSENEKIAALSAEVDSLRLIVAAIAAPAAPAKAPAPATTVAPAKAPAPATTVAPAKAAAKATATTTAPTVAATVIVAANSTADTASIAVADNCEGDSIAAGTVTATGTVTADTASIAVADSYEGDSLAAGNATADTTAIAVADSCEGDSLAAGTATADTAVKPVAKVEVLKNRLFVAGGFFAGINKDSVNAKLMAYGIGWKHQGLVDFQFQLASVDRLVVIQELCFLNKTGTLGVGTHNDIKAFPAPTQGSPGDARMTLISTRWQQLPWKANPWGLKISGDYIKQGVTALATLYAKFDLGKRFELDGSFSPITLSSYAQIGKSSKKFKFAVDAKIDMFDTTALIGGRIGYVDTISVFGKRLFSASYINSEHKTGKAGKADYSTILLHQGINYNNLAFQGWINVGNYPGQEKWAVKSAALEASYKLPQTKSASAVGFIGYSYRLNPNESQFGLPPFRLGDRSTVMVGIRFLAKNY